MLWRYWDWEQINKKYVKHISRILFLFLSVFLMISIHKKASFDVLNVYVFTSKRPELMKVYPVISVSALPYLQEALLLCLYIVPILILVTWIPDANNIKFFSMLYKFSLILFGLVLLAYMLGLVFLLKATNPWFIFFVIVILLIIGTLIISNICSKMLKEEPTKYSIICKILLAIVAVFSIGLEIFLAYPKVIDSKDALEHRYLHYCSYIRSLTYDIFSMTRLSYSSYFIDIRDELQNGNKAYIILNYINLYSSEEYTFTAEEIIEAQDALENYDLSTNASSWNKLNTFFYAATYAGENNSHLEKYDMYDHLLGYGNTPKEAFFENVIRRLYEQGHIEDVNSLVDGYVDRIVIDDACKYVYDIFESGLFEPIDEVTIKATYENGEYTLTTNEGEPYFLHLYTTNSNKSKIQICLYHSVGYYFDENTVITVEGLDNYSVSDIELVFMHSNKDKYADINFSIFIE